MLEGIKKMSARSASRSLGKSTRVRYARACYKQEILMEKVIGIARTIVNQICMNAYIKKSGSVIGQKKAAMLYALEQRGKRRLVSRRGRKTEMGSRETQTCRTVQAFNSRECVCENPCVASIGGTL